ncbi:MAG: TRAP transporter large permease subunit, partial [Burkholderiaceae bacterium]
MFGIGSAAIAILALKLPPTTLMQLSFDAMTKQVLVAIPIFVFAGNVMLHGGAAQRLVELALKLVGHLPGGLGVAMVVAMGTFGAICGSILAAIVAIGTMMMPTMVKSGYPRPFVVVLAAAAALIDALIPPSNTAIIFSSLTNVPVSRTFAAGVLPGFVLMGLLVTYVMWRCRTLARAERADWSERFGAFWKAVPVLTMPFGILGGIYSGLLTPAEAASF